MSQVMLVAGIRTTCSAEIIAHIIDDLAVDFVIEFTGNGKLSYIIELDTEVFELLVQYYTALTNPLEAIDIADSPSDAVRQLGRDIAVFAELWIISDEVLQPSASDQLAASIRSLLSTAHEPELHSPDYLKDFVKLLYIRDVSTPRLKIDEPVQGEKEAILRQILLEQLELLYLHGDRKSLFLDFIPHLLRMEVTGTLVYKSEAVPDTQGQEEARVVRLREDRSGIEKYQKPFSTAHSRGSKRESST